MSSSKSVRPQAVFNVVLIIIFGVGLLFAWYAAWSWYDGDSQQVTNFDECVEATGGAVMLSYPAQCAYNGKTFVDQKQLNDFNSSAGANQ